MQMFISSSLLHVRIAICSVLLIVGPIAVADAAVGDLRSARAWLSDFPTAPRSWRALEGPCREIRETGAAIRSAYGREMAELDAQFDNPEEMSEDQIMEMLMPGGNIQEVQSFVQAQMQMVETVVDDKGPALGQRKEQTGQELTLLEREMDEEIHRCVTTLPDCGHDGEGMTASEAACWQQREQQAKQCRRTAADRFLSSTHSPLYELKADLLIYLENRESELLEQETSQQSKYLQAQWQRARIELLEQVVDYAELMTRACVPVEYLRLAEE